MTRTIAAAITCLVVAALQGCKHPLAIVGEGDIVELNGSGRGCSLEQHAAQDTACVDNEVEGDYFVNYKAQPRPGWRFVRWQGPCGPDSDFGHCRLQVTADVVAQWDAGEEHAQAPPSTAVFQPVSGATGYLLAGTPVAGVAYTTATQQGVTGLDGSFQYAEGERVRFAIGATTLGEVAGKDRVTPFDLAGSPVLQGSKIAWALQDENDPLNGVINLSVLLQSLDRDGIPGNGIVITRGVAELLAQVKLELYQRVDEFGGYNDPQGGTMLVAQDWERFWRDPTLRHLLGRANRERRFSARHGVAMPGTAIARLYQALGIDPRISGLSYSQIQNHDGENWARLAYDAAGRLIEHEKSGFGGASETWQYNARGQLTLHEQIADEVNHYQTTISAYDSRGNLTHSETQSGGNNAGGSGYRLELDRRYDRDSVEIWEENVRTSQESTETEFEAHSYRYDKRGRLARYTSDSEQRYSDGSNFHTVEYSDYLHDATGALRVYSLARDVNDVDGVPEQNLSWWYDPLGRVTRHESTFALSPDQGEPAQLVWTWQYDASGRVTRFREGGENWLFRYQYDPDGNTTRRERVSEPGGTVGEIVTWGYDDNGRVVKKEVTSIGTAPYSAGERETATQSWQYHPNGEVSLYTYEFAGGFSDRGPSFEVSEKREYRFDTRGNLTRYSSLNEFDFGDSPEPYQEVRSWQYDGAGNLVREEVANNGSDSFVHTWQYDSDGNPTRWESDYDGDGKVDETKVYRYTLTGWGFLFAGVAPFGANLPMPSKPGEGFDYFPPPEPPSSPAPR